ncbi:hypothetical protein AKJ16_DCAP07743 [Drosera capensis]
MCSVRLWSFWQQLRGVKLNTADDEPDVYSGMDIGHYIPPYLENLMRLATGIWLDTGIGKAYSSHVPYTPLAPCCFFINTYLESNDGRRELPPEK